MAQLDLLKIVLDNPDVDDSILNFYLDKASSIICEIRNSNIVETQYLEVQIEIAVELFNKRGAEGQSSHSENGIARAYEASSVSPSLLNQITPMVKTPFSGKRIIT